ncbi:hypothetical protein ACFYOY_47305 [Streptomyces sp. NPDC007875]|uniref:hypothetical protein n=1 Tax=Streptomyces sp. NPDC007875 TaxID=3364783 RepID=UPI0036A05FD9
MTDVARSVDDHGSHLLAGGITREDAVAASDVDDGPSTLGGQATGDRRMDVTSCREALRGCLVRGEAPRIAVVVTGIASQLSIPARPREPMDRVWPRINT